MRYYRQQAGTRVAVRVVNATNKALDQIELGPGLGSPTLGKLLGVPELRTWRVERFPLLWCYFERGGHLDVVRLLESVKTLPPSWATSSPRSDALESRRSRAGGQRQSTPVRSPGWSAGPFPSLSCDLPRRMTAADCKQPFASVHVRGPRSMGRATEAEAHQSALKVLSARTWLVALGFSCFHRPWFCDRLRAALPSGCSELWLPSPGWPLWGGRRC